MTTNDPAAAAAFVPTMPPVGVVFGDESVLGTSAHGRTVFVDSMIAEVVQGVPPRGVPV